MEIRRNDFYPNNLLLDIRNLTVEDINCKNRGTYELILSKNYEEKYTFVITKAEFKLFIEKISVFSQHSVKKDTPLDEIKEFIHGKNIDFLFEIHYSYIYNDAEYLHCRLKNIEFSPVSLQDCDEMTKSVKDMGELDFVMGSDGFAEKKAVVTATLIGMKDFVDNKIDVYFEVELASDEYEHYDEGVYLKQQLHIDELRSLFSEYISFGNLDTVTENIGQKFVLDVSYMFDPSKYYGPYEEIIWINKLSKLK